MQHRRLAPFLFLASAGCLVPKGAKPDVDLGLGSASKFVHRGMTMVDRPVLHPELAVGLPTRTGGTVGVAIDGNMDLYNNTGDAWFPDGHAGRFTQVEMIADYAQSFDWLSLRGGVHTYILPNGLEFVNGERGGTSEVFLTASANVLETNPYLSLHYDFDEVRDLYWRAGLSEDIPFGSGFVLRLDGSIGHAGADQSSWMYGIERSAWADLRGSAFLDYAIDPTTTLSLGAHGSLIVDSVLDQWFTDIGIDPTVYWFSLGVTWTF
ncbi:MAG: hypothetical protein JNK49_07700 [Planctomycetes bacterium]|nr:hypothetical protein [Planctomycetota bacterium]